MENSITRSTSGSSLENDLSNVYPAEANTGDLVGPPVLAVTATETDTSTDSSTFSANDVTGLSFTSTHEVDTVNRPETISHVSSETNGGKYSWTTIDS
ncbi:MAG TPA: hypothetical protein VND64_33950, partial [Pirellulales bacterium]|nr:hypothetical protein [Pirellulales bacterium]